MVVRAVVTLDRTILRPNRIGLGRSPSSSGNSCGLTPSRADGPNSRSYSSRRAAAGRERAAVGEARIAEPQQWESSRPWARYGETGLRGRRLFGVGGPTSTISEWRIEPWAPNDHDRQRPEARSTAPDSRRPCPNHVRTDP